MCARVLVYVYACIGYLNEQCMNVAFVCMLWRYLGRAVSWHSISVNEHVCFIDECVCVFVCMYDALPKLSDRLV